MSKSFSIRGLWRKLQADANSAIVARGAIGSFVVKILGAAIAFGLHILLARLLGVNLCPSQTWNKSDYYYNWVIIHYETVNCFG